MQIRKIQVREYYCPMCGNTENHKTNHVGEIYTRCKRCGHTPLYCHEGDVEREALPQVRAKLVVYGLDICPEHQERMVEYLKLCSDLRDKGYEKFAVLPYITFCAIKKHDGETITLYNPDQFPTQYVSNIGRVHQWYEAVYPNQNIKDGYYLVMEGACDR